MQPTLNKYIYDNILGDGIGNLEVIQFCGTEKMIVNAARVSHRKDCLDNPELLTDDIKLIKFLIEHRHTSPLEHTLLTIKVKLPMPIGEQWLRHRMASYNKESGRYIELTEPEFYVPTEFRGQSKSNRQASYRPPQQDDMIVDYFDPWGIYKSDMKKHFEMAKRLYNDMITAGIAKEQARMVLPQGTYMSMYATANLHSWLHFITLRNAPDAQWEMQQYAQAVESVLSEIWPNALAKFKEVAGHESS